MTMNDVAVSIWTGQQRPPFLLSSLISPAMFEFMAHNNTRRVRQDKCLGFSEIVVYVSMLAIKMAILGHSQIDFGTLGVMVTLGGG